MAVNDSTTNSLAPGETATVFIIAWADDYTTSPGVLQGEGSATIFESFMPDLETVPIPSPGVLAMGAVGIAFGGRRRRA